MDSQKKIIGWRLPLLLFLAYFFLLLITLNRYGINWDTINHLPRGQSYLNYFLTGNKDFSNIPKYVAYFQDPNTIFFSPSASVPRVSIYQDAGVDFNYFMQHDGGHPPLGGIAASFFNLVFFQKLGIFNDIDSYRLYGLLLSSVLIGVVFYFTSKRYGYFSGFVAAVTLASYPLFWSESHFNNEKDVPETVFYSLMLLFLWLGISKSKSRYVLISSIFFGFALSTKFNAFFAIFIIIPYLLFELISTRKFFSPRILLSLLLFPFIGFFIFFVLWPYLWADPISRFISIFSYYKDIGISAGYDARFIGPFNIRTYPFFAFLFTTPPFVLFLLILGVCYSLYRSYKYKESFSFLVLIWFVVPLARVSYPGANIYGGLRQIMEYIPPLAILSGSSAFLFQKLVKKNFLIVFLVACGFVFHLLRLVSIHPYENVYYNFLVGGLSGAKSINFPYWGFSFGAPYRDAIQWINLNALPNSRAAYAYELIPNIPKIFVRRDVELHNRNRSGYSQNGEYIVTLRYDGTSNRSYFDRYLEKMLVPVYQGVVDGVPIVKVWQNTPQYLRPEYKEEKKLQILSFYRTSFGFRVDLGSTYYLSRAIVSFSESHCDPLISAYSQISTDGNSFTRLPGVLPDEDWYAADGYGIQPLKDHFVEPFASDYARYIDYVVNPLSSCLATPNKVEVYYFPNAKG